MARSVAHPVHAAIDAPDGAAALELERRLADLEPTAIGRGYGWTVEVPAAPAREELEAIVRDWLRMTGVPRTTIRLDGETFVVTAPPRRTRPAHRASHRDFIG